MRADPLLQRLDAPARRALGEPEPALARERDRAVRVVEEVLGDTLRPGGVRVSPLGAGWSVDVDAHVKADPGEERARAAGWVPLDGLLGALGTPSSGRWAVTDEGRVLAMVDIHLAPPPDQVEAVLRRCRRRGEVRAREILELRALVRAGRTLPDSAVVRAAARGERAMGGDSLARWNDGREPAPSPVVPPVPLSGPLRWARRVLRRPGRRLVVAISGVDGAGKSSLAERLREDLRRLGIGATLVWTRPGLSIGWLDPVARRMKALMGDDPRPAVERVAGGSASPRSRRGVTGWVWALLVTLTFVRGARRGLRTAPPGVVLFDRHLLDALVTLDVVYRGVPLGLHRALVRLFLPKAALTLYLDLPPEAAARRKPDPVFDETAIRRQLAGYATYGRGLRNVHRLDATRPRDELAGVALHLLGELGDGRGDGVGR